MMKFLTVCLSFLVIYAGTMSLSSLSVGFVTSFWKPNPIGMPTKFLVNIMRWFFTIPTISCMNPRDVKISRALAYMITHKNIRLQTNHMYIHKLTCLDVPPLWIMIFHNCTVFNSKGFSHLFGVESAMMIFVRVPLCLLGCIQKFPS